MDANLIEIIVILVVAGLAGLGKLLGAMQQAQQREIMRQKAMQAGQPERGEPADAGDEIEEFMRRAAEERAAKRAAVKQRAAAKQRAAQPQISGGIERPVHRRKPPRPAEKPVQAEVVGEAPLGGNVAKQAQKHLDSSKFGQRTHPLGGEAAQADRQLDQHPHQAFDHRMSSLQAVPGAAAKPPKAFNYAELTGEASLDEIPATFATSLTDFLTDPESVRQAIVFNEILRRPEERWG